jgi:hypothetical protein
MALLRSTRPGLNVLSQVRPHQDGAFFPGALPLCYRDIAFWQAIHFAD